MDYSHRISAHCHSASSQIYTGAIPFSNSMPAAAMLAIMDGKRPPRPTDQQFTDQLWTLMQHCWDQDPLSRPEVSEVFRILRDWWVLFDDHAVVDDGVLSCLATPLR